MCVFTKDYFRKKRIKKITDYVKYAEEEMSFFKIVEISDKKVERLIEKCKRDSFFAEFVASYGPFFGCHSYPHCNYKQQSVDGKPRNKIGF